MSLIEWRDEFCTGISGIDYEHQELIRSINTFFESLDKNSNKKALVDALDGIYAEIYSHFVLEERLMKKHNYDQYEIHRNDHARLLDEIRDITLSFLGSTVQAGQHLEEALGAWFSIHFKTHDARLHRLQKLMTGAATKGNAITGFFGKH